MREPSTRWTPVVRVSGRSMEPTLRPGTLVLTRPRPRRVGRGRVVILARPDGSRFVKRVAGVGGDLIELEAGRLRVNGRPLDGRSRIPGARVSSWQVPDGHYFVVGDNPALSDDSRVWPDPFVPHPRIVGVALTGTAG